MEKEEVGGADHALARDRPAAVARPDEEPTLPPPARLDAADQFTGLAAELQAKVDNSNHELDLQPWARFQDYARRDIGARTRLRVTYRQRRPEYQVRRDDSKS